MTVCRNTLYTVYTLHTHLLSHSQYTLNTVSIHSNYLTISLSHYLIISLSHYLIISLALLLLLVIIHHPMVILLLMNVIHHPHPRPPFQKPPKLLPPQKLQNLQPVWINQQRPMRLRRRKVGMEMGSVSEEFLVG